MGHSWLDNISEFIASNPKGSQLMGFSLVAIRKKKLREVFLDNWTFGITVTVVGMGGTFLTLWILSAIMYMLKKVYPQKDTVKSRENKKRQDP